MKLSDRAEEILETLWVELVEQKQAHCDITLFKYDEAVAELSEGGHVTIDANKISLTGSGRDEARDCIRRHRLAERLLADVLSAKNPVVHQAGCGFEHLLHKGLDESICTLLGHPRTCPHGKPIPEGRCCREARREAGKLILRLTEMEPGEQGTIAYLHTHDRDALQKLIAMGALPGVVLRLAQKFPTLVMQIGQSQFAIDKELASHIHVRRTEQT
jgi:DtxR family Mn-dependent transcriptional regulator